MDGPDDTCKFGDGALGIYAGRCTGCLFSASSSVRKFWCLLDPVAVAPSLVSSGRGRWW